MLTALPAQEQDRQISTMQSLMYNNDFIGKNRNMLAFYREHDSEKRQAFTKLRDFFSMRAKCNREQKDDMKRMKVQNFMSRWDEYRVRRDVVVEALVKVHKRRDACRYWHVMNVKWKFYAYIMNVIKQHRQNVEQFEKEQQKAAMLLKQRLDAGVEDSEPQSDFDEFSPVHQQQQDANM
mmetsp:Transcript_2353/g.3227  ORF Transcript_2353/g.3227 Transcript_2353/m.3227 type:complete len:179 (+) Transcript_2353:1300-1836(+)|eukprot:CAMPEP_0185586050 /NCGR_PEP_ID=MMETSP0434-20130131/42234_1 /TAXON_ID=626734 ORGANISM="Favella taraikaensis, Strain Fe Narragansett Bay" /NCGR_SAMPLE_ID=MMETSP0434 /ASSEMBLY_ACC=CAM_ASM_000379 /LENGTH=178 /DNA_ID=CAMNT_0028206843 /DNA_START=1289 /DNA_END=1825 /DNA_ORIENTATION=-